jgi:hypothetical protein
MFLFICRKRKMQLPEKLKEKEKENKKEKQIKFDSLFSVFIYLENRICFLIL